MTKQISDLFNVPGCPSNAELADVFLQFSQMFAARAANDQTIDEKWDQEETRNFLSQVRPGPTGFREILVEDPEVMEQLRVTHPDYVAALEDRCLRK